MMLKPAFHRWRFKIVRTVVRNHYHKAFANWRGNYAAARNATGRSKQRQLLPASSAARNSLENQL